VATLVNDPPLLPYVLATYREIALRLGLTGPDAARMRAKRAGWELEPVNHPADPRRVRVPREIWDDPPVAPDPEPNASPLSPPIAPDVATVLADARERAARLEGELVGVREALIAERSRAERAEQGEQRERERADRAEQGKEQQRTRAEDAEGRERVVIAQVGRLGAELATARAEAEARERLPWWRRLKRR